MDWIFCILSVVCSAVCFYYGCVLGWRAHITYLQAQSGELQKAEGAIIDVAPQKENSWDNENTFQW